jgi:hypothetical protein
VLVKVSYSSSSPLPISLSVLFSLPNILRNVRVGGIKGSPKLFRVGAIFETSLIIGLETY